MSEYIPAEKAEFDPQVTHDTLLETAPRRLRYRPGTGAETREEHRNDLKEVLTAVLGLPRERISLEPHWFPEESRALPSGPEIGSPDTAPPMFSRITVRRVEFFTEEKSRAIGWLVTPTNDSGMGRPAAKSGNRTPKPTIICLQGHTSGAHISLGEERFAQDHGDITAGKDYALQAARRGYNAFVLEQRNFGERMDSREPSRRQHYDYENPFTDERCRHQAMVAILVGRTVLGERVLDVQRAVDLLNTHPDVLPDRIYCMGNSGGGTTAFYATCLEPRIAGVMPSCSFAPYASTIGTIDHCSDNYLPGALKWFDMPDLALLIAPRPMVVIAGKKDPIFPLNAITEAYTQAAQIYQEQNATEHLAFHVGAEGHTFYPEAWQSFEGVTGIGSADE